MDNSKVIGEDCGFDIVAYKLPEILPTDTFEEDYDDEEIKNFYSNRWRFVTVLVCAERLGVKLGATYMENVPDGYMSGDFGYEDAFDVVELDELGRQSLEQAQEIVMYMFTKGDTDV